MKKALLEVISLSVDVVTTSGGNACNCNFGNIDPNADTAADDC